MYVCEGASAINGHTELHHANTTNKHVSLVFVFAGLLMPSRASIADLTAFFLWISTSKVKGKGG
jgi:hypothetical protein